MEMTGPSPLQAQRQERHDSLRNISNLSQVPSEPNPGPRGHLNQPFLKQLRGNGCVSQLTAKRTQRTSLSISEDPEQRARQTKQHREQGQLPVNSQEAGISQVPIVFTLLFPAHFCLWRLTCFSQGFRKKNNPGICCIFGLKDRKTSQGPVSFRHSRSSQIPVSFSKWSCLHPHKALSLLGPGHMTGQGLQPHRESFLSHYLLRTQQEPKQVLLAASKGVGCILQTRQESELAGQRTKGKTLLF